MREKTLASVDLEAIDGIISFPSVHATVAIILPYTLRCNKFIFWPIALLDGMMIISAVPSGNHYLADVIAGIVVAVVAIAGAGAIERWQRNAGDAAREPALSGDIGRQNGRELSGPGMAAP